MTDGTTGEAGTDAPRSGTRSWRETRHGRPVVCRSAEGPAAARLATAAEFLRSAAHPDLVELVALEEPAAAPVVLVTAAVEGPRLDEAPATAAEVAPVVAALASTLADLHDLGLVHGSVAPEHVLVAGGRAVLCGLGGGGPWGARVGPPAVPPPYRDPSRGDDDPLDPAHDIFGLGVVLLHLVDRGGTAAGPAETGLSVAGYWSALEGLAERATAPVAADRPPARWLADALADAAGDLAGGVGSAWSAAAASPGPEPASAGWPPAAGAPAGPGSGPDGGGEGSADPTTADGEGTWPAQPLTPRPPLDWPRPPARQPRTRARRVGVAAAVAAVAAVGALVAATAGPTSRAAPPSSSGAAEEPTTARAAGTAAATATAAGPGPAASTTEASAPVPGSAGRGSPSPAPRSCAGAQGPLVADVDGDGCPESLAFDAGRLTAGAWTWAVGTGGDVVAVGDWTCSGTRTLALLRPASGVVYRFAAWPLAGELARAEVVDTIAGGQGLRAADLDGDGCHELLVEGAPGGSRVAGADG